VTIRFIMPWKATGPGDVTLLRAPGKCLTKLITPAGIVDYDRAAVFEVEAERLDCVEDFAELLTRAAGDPHVCSIRGALRPEFAGRPLVLRRCRPRPGEPPRFAPAARSWLMVDVEGLPIPPGVDPADPAMAGGAARRALPAPFRAARAVVQLSAKAGLLPEIRVHLWFMLDRAITDAEAKRWLRGAPVDPSIYQPVGIHYTASPIFMDVDDPCIDGRLAILPGYAEVAVPDLPEPQPARQASTPAEARPYVAPPRGLGFRSTRAEAYMLACLRAVADATPGDRHPTIVRISTRLFGLAKGGALDPADVSARVQGAVGLSTFDRDHAEVIAALRWAWDHSTPWKLT
jgi:hypothetical protein